VVTSHSYWEHGGLSTINLENFVSQATKPKERKFVCVATTVLHNEFLGMNKK
jgi:hypothetical protein